VGDIITSHGVKCHQYADDTQLRLSTHAEDTAEGLAVLGACTTDVRQWYMYNGLQLKQDKSEALIVGTSGQLTSTSAMSSVFVAVVDLPQCRIHLWGDRSDRPPAPIDENLRLVMAARLRHGGKFSLKC